MKLQNWVRVNDDTTTVIIADENNGSIDAHTIKVIVAWFELHTESVEIVDTDVYSLQLTIIHPFASHLTEPLIVFLKTLTID